MKKIIYIFLFLPFLIFSQDQEKEKKKVEEVKVKLADKQVLRKGNDLYKQKRFTDAQAQYKKALSQNQTYQTAHYNLANTFYEQDKFEEALPGYDFTAKSTKNKTAKAQSFHNMGNVFMKQKQYEKAISVYKSSLRINPKDDETRYNLALAQDLLKKQNKDKNKDNKDKKDKKDKNKDKDKNSENKDKKDKKNKDKDKKDDKSDKKDKDQNKGDDDKDKKNQNKSGDDEKKDKQQPKPQPNKLSKQQIEQLLEAMNNEENKTQKKVNAKKARGRKIKQEKDW